MLKSCRIDRKQKKYHWDMRDSNASEGQNRSHRLTQISMIEIGTGVINCPKMGHKKQNFSRPPGRQILKDDQRNSKIAHSGHNNRETKTGQVWGLSSTLKEVRPKIVQLNKTRNDDDGYFISAYVNEKPVT